MSALDALAGVQHEAQFPFFDALARPTRCELHIHPTRSWAIATDLPAAGASLTSCYQTLAIKLCQHYHLEPANLVLLLRYVYSQHYENLYLVRFGHGERDLFDGVRLGSPRHELLHPHQHTELYAELESDAPLADQWRSLYVAP